MSSAESLEAVQGDAAVTDLARALARGLQGEEALSRGDVEGGVDLLKESIGEINYIFMLSSPFFGRSRERFLLAQSYESLGRIDEAMRWYATFEEFSMYDLIYSAPAQMALARIHEARGNGTRAHRHYRQVRELWKDADPALQSMVDEANAAIARLGASP